MDPLAHDHLVDAHFAIVVFFLNCLLEDAQPSTLAILQLDQSVSNTGAHDRYEAQENARVDVHKDAALFWKFNDIFTIFRYIYTLYKYKSRTAGKCS